MATLFRAVAVVSAVLSGAVTALSVGCQVIERYDEFHGPACGSVTGKNPSCTSCLELKCCSEMTECGEMTSCADAFDCMGKQTDAAGRSACLKKSSWPDKLSALLSCQASLCDAACTLDQCGGGLTFLPAQALDQDGGLGECAKCESASACDDITTCMKDSFCLDFAACSMTKCEPMDIHCITQCESYYSGDPGDEFGNALQSISKCRGQCGLGTTWGCVGTPWKVAADLKSINIQASVLKEDGSPPPTSHVRACPSKLDPLCANPGAEADTNEGVFKVTVSLPRADPFSHVGPGFSGFFEVRGGGEAGDLYPALIVPMRPILGDMPALISTAGGGPLTGWIWYEPGNVDIDIKNPAPGTAILHLAVRDCLGQPASGVTFALLPPSAQPEYVDSPTGLHETSIKGEAWVYDVPVGNGVVEVTASTGGKKVADQPFPVRAGFQTDCTLTPSD